MEKKIKDALNVFSTLLNQIENNVGQIKDPLCQINCAQRRVINLINDMYFEEPALLNQEFGVLITSSICDLWTECYLLLDECGAEQPEGRDCEGYLTEPLNVYLLYFVHEKLFQIMDYIEEMKETEIPVWYSLCD
ncbi:hypothetical protein AAKU52_000630 [Pedobacter sp. CG_S7]|uniref:hypothetical protein n=1 Tax=Pedobacter sp. CG_S7 TaxID=3143930 RepID=UPI0033930CB1